MAINLTCLQESGDSKKIGEAYCTPILMLNTTYEKPTGFCNVSGTQCYRAAVEKAKSEIDYSECPSECTLRRFDALAIVDSWNDILSYEPEVQAFIAQNPIEAILTNHSSISSINDVNYEKYITASGESLDISMVQIYFDYHQKTVITKDAKVTVPDMVSNIGGTIGIFLGLSTISVFDIFKNKSKFS